MSHFQLSDSVHQTISFAIQRESFIKLFEKLLLNFQVLFDRKNCIQGSYFTSEDYKKYLKGGKSCYTKNTY